MQKFMSLRQIGYLAVLGSEPKAYKKRVNAYTWSIVSDIAPGQLSLIHASRIRYFALDHVRK